MKAKFKSLVFWAIFFSLLTCLMFWGVFFFFFSGKIGPVLTDFIQQAKVAAYLLQCLAFFWYPNVRKYSPSSLYQDALTIPAHPSSQRIGTVLQLMCNFKTFDKV